MNLIDTHAHINDNSFDPDREQIIQDAVAAGLCAIINVGTNLASSKESIELSEAYKNIWAAVGLHPHDASTLNEKNWKEFVKLTGHEKVVAVGEVGLDYYRMLSPKDDQQMVFRRFIGLAQEKSLPVIIHSRDASEDTLQILGEEKPQAGVLHAFSGDMDLLKAGLDLGLYISITGTVTFKKSRVAPLVNFIPLNRLLLETDCPYLTPDPYRGKRNQPAFVRFVAEKVAEILGLAVEEVIEINRVNACRLFGLGK
ncbi:TatD family hydrolase [Candidatus Desantisbacteria bacterium]|nr:TatD family hydrolase [Candidatus Desantisbacteria bacterium]